MANAYAPPTPLQDLHILDMLELADSQSRAGVALSMHQSTVCRSAQLMQSQFRLVPQQSGAVCRYGHNICLHYLRLAYREPRFHEQAIGGKSGAPVAGPVLEPLGQLELQLVTATPVTRRVLLPRKGAMPLLRAAVERHGFAVEQQPLACQEPAAWIKRARDRRLALPLCTDLMGARWLESHQLVPLAEQPVLIEQLWLLLPQGMENSLTVQQCLRYLRSQITRAKTMQNAHGIQS